jgi:hypothetical protein
MWLAIRAFAYHVQDSGFNPPVPSKKKIPKNRKRMKKENVFQAPVDREKYLCF